MENMFTSAKVIFLVTVFTVLVNMNEVHSQSAPKQATAVGYSVRTFSTVAFNSSTVDTTNSHNKGFQWYPWNFFSQPVVNLSRIVLNSQDGSVTLQGEPGTNNGQLTTATTSYSSTCPIIGTAFGGGAYFEATFSFDPNVVFKQNLAVSIKGG